MAASSTQRISSAKRLADLAGDAGGSSMVPPWAEALGSKLVDDMASLWREGRGPSAEELLAQHQQLCDHPEVAVRVIYEEICQREQAGDEVNTLEVIGRFPQWQGEIEMLMGCHRLMESSPKRPKFPKAGEQIGEFRLISELDRGAAGRVFLARQPGLSDRPVVVKLTPCTGGEHLSLARLQHTHIVPLYLAQDFPERNLRALCMPYVGGLSLARVLKAIAGKPIAQRRGSDISAVLEQCLAASSAPLPQHGPALEFLSRASYEQSICWIGACLADALDYAHQRGLVHLDVKPSNVLMAGDGQPMLLDFHLAREPILPDGASAVWMGGTAGYMSPEQQTVLLAIGDGRPAATAVDGRADLYSLGMLLYEALGGQVPDQSQNEVPRLENHNSQISTGVADIIHKCLAPLPENRYATAASLAEDLRRHLAAMPLRQVANRNLAERWQKWRRRHPQSLTRVAMLVVVVATAALLVRSQFVQRLRTADAALTAGKQQLARLDYESAAESFARGMAALDGWILTGNRSQVLAVQLQRTRRLKAAHHLKEFVERLRFLDIRETLPADNARQLANGCRAVWEKRAMLIPADDWPADQKIDQQVRADLVEMVLLWDHLEERLAQADPAAPRDSTSAVAQAERLCGPHLALDLARINLGDEQAAELNPHTAWEHVAVGRHWMDSGRLADAAAHFEQAVNLEPQAFWPNFYLAICAYRGQQFDLALNGFSACVALAPQRAECYYNRALAHAAVGNIERAIADDGRALDLDPTLATAALHRARLYCRLRQFDDAEADLGRAQSAGADAASVHYTRAVLHLGRGDRSAALVQAQRTLDHQPDHAEARLLHNQLNSGWLNSGQPNSGQ
jgi:serine/threonine protein kinase/Tfp pilus assembly protein PilF